MQASSAELEKLFNKLDLLTDAIFDLARAQAKQTESETTDWLDSTAFIAKAGIKDRSSLSYYVQKGIFDSTALKNIGTVKKPRYRFHCLIAMDQFLNSSAKQNGVKLCR